MTFRVEPDRVMILSSWVAAGHVGLSAAGPVLQALGRRVTALPTVMLSNHPGFPRVAGRPTTIATLEALADALEANGWLAGHAALLIGYMPTPDHVGLAARFVTRMRKAAPELRVIVDPILGDTPQGLYVKQPVAEAIRDSLVPLADALTPNRFELGWLAGRPADRLADALAAARTLCREAGADVLLTSPPLAEGETGILTVTQSGAHLHATPAVEDVPHGIGDAFAGLVAGGLPPDAALGHIAALARESRGAPHLRIAEAAPRWTAAPPVPGIPFPPATTE